MNLLHLQYFYVVAREGGFTKAAKILRIQQPAISRMVKQLEDSFGVALLERVGRGVQLTAQGQEVLAHCQRIFGEVEALQTALGQLSGTPRGSVAFAAAEPIASHLVPDLLARVLPQHPELYPIVHSGPAAVLFEQIARGSLEFGLFFHVPSVPTHLQVQVVRKERFYLVARTDLKRDSKVLKSFIGSREIDDVSVRTFPTLEKLKRLAPKAAIKISSNNLTAHRALVLKGLGVAVLPDFLVGEDLKRRRMVDLLPQDRLEFDLRLVKRAGANLGLNARALLANC